LGLIILPFEQTDQKNKTYWNTLISDIPELTGMFDLKHFEPIRRKLGQTKGGGIEYYPKDLTNLLRKIRHGLAHQKITPEIENRNGKKIITRLNIKNYFKDYQKVKHLDLEIEFTQDQLKEFALFIGKEYLKNN
jgi:hypothetical protein